VKFATTFVILATLTTSDLQWHWQGWQEDRDCGKTAVTAVILQ